MESSSDNLEVLKVASASCIAWTVLFQMWPVPTAEKDVEGAKSRYLSTLHAVLAILSAAAFWAMQDVQLWSPEYMVVGPGGWLDDWMRFTVAVSIGYFAHDLVVVLKYPSLYDPAIVAHHVVIGGFFALGIIDHSYTPFHFLFLLEELSTPLLNMRWHYRADKLHIGHWGAEYAFAATFFFARIFFGNIALLAAVSLVQPHFNTGYPPNKHAATCAHMWAQIVACVLSRILNLFWFYKIVRMLVRHRAQRRASAADKAKKGN